MKCNWQARMIEDGPSRRQAMVIGSLWIGRTAEISTVLIMDGDFVKR